LGASVGHWSLGRAGELFRSASGVKRGEMGSRLPTSDYAPCPSAGLCLSAAALLLIPADLALFRYGAAHPEAVVTGSRIDRQVVGGIETEVMTEDLLELRPLWTDAVRVAIPVLALTALIALGRVSRRDVGLTLERPRLTLFWVAVPAAAVLTVGLLALLAAIGLVRWAGLPPPSGLGEPMIPRVCWERGYVWREFWHMCVLTPLFEDTLYRGVLAAALERLGGARLAVLGSGVAWASLHVIYDRPVAWVPFYFAFGMLGAWVFLKARSLVPLVVLHAAWNTAVPFGYDLLVLQATGFIPGLFGWPAGPAGG
jgi:membrane protease YdiL (CAAX protease family)